MPRLHRSAAIEVAFNINAPAGNGVRTLVETLHLSENTLGFIAAARRAGPGPTKRLPRKHALSSFFRTICHKTATGGVLVVKGI